MSPNSQISVLYAVDLNGSSREALQWSIAMAKQLNAHLTILYTYRFLQNKTDGVAFKQNQEREANEQFSILEKELLTGKDVSYNFSIEIGFITDRIADYIKKNQLSLLVLDKTIATANHESFEELVNQTKVPTMVIP